MKSLAPLARVGGVANVVQCLLYQPGQCLMLLRPHLEKVPSIESPNSRDTSTWEQVQRMLRELENVKGGTGNKLGEEEAVKEQSWRSQTTCRGRQGKV